MRALKIAAMYTLIAAVAVVLIFGSLVGTFHVFSMFVVMTEGWQLIASVVWFLELVFMLVFCLERLG